MRTPELRDRSPSHVWPISVLVYGAPALADALATEDDDTRIERDRTEDPARARELARIVGPDVVVIDADRPNARELVGDLVEDPLVEPAPIVVVGTFDQPEAAGAFVELGAARVLLKPCSPDTLRRTVQELRDRAPKPGPTRDPVGEVTVSALAERIAGEFRRGLVDALDGGAQATRVSLGEGHDVLAAVWGAVARVRELVTLHSEGSVRFQPTGPEGGVPLQPWSAEERRAGERGSRETRSGEGVSLSGRRLVIADDDPAVVWFMAGLLKAVGAEVIEAHDGQQALDLVYSRLPDAVITDVLMPKLDGFSLCHEIKRDVAVRDVPVILLSWKEDLLQRLRELGADADGYLRKEAAASAVVERVREVLHSRARVEERIRAGGEVRGRLDGMTPRLVLELACRADGDLRVSIRDAAFLYEVQIRRGGMRSVTRSSPDGGFARGEAVLPSLLGVSAGRFVVEPDASPCRAELTGSFHEVIAGPIARARAALAKVAEKSLVRLERLELDRELVTAYLDCTPEPAATLTRRLLAGESAKDLVLSGEVAPRLGIGHVVERLHHSLAAPRQEPGVLFLDAGRIGQHDRAEIAGGRGGPDRAVEAVAHQQRQPAGMVNVGMTEDDPVDPPGIDRQLGVERLRLAAPTLEEAGVEEDPGPSGLEQVHRAGDPAGGTPERETPCHASTPSMEKGNCGVPRSASHQAW
jgi:DNA-binding response OmpR family regulator